MSGQLKELHTKHRAVARYLALGIPLRDICSMYSFNYNTWSQIISTPLFKQEVARIEGELEDKILDDAVKDPVLAKLRVAAGRAADRLVTEIDACGEDSNASTRLKAASSVLDRLGYISKEEEKSGPSIMFISLSAEKLAGVLGKKGLAAQPESVQG